MVLFINRNLSDIIWTIWAPKMKVANERKKKEEKEEGFKIVLSY